MDEVAATIGILLRNLFKMFQKSEEIKSDKK